jgi:hypothetical protein
MSFVADCFTFHHFVYSNRGEECGKPLRDGPLPTDISTYLKGASMPRISKSELIKLQKQLGTDDAIGKKFGITRQAVHQLRKQYGIDSSIADNPERNAKIIAQYQKGVSGTDLAKKNGLSVSQTYRIINDAGVGKKAPAKKAKKKK